jgi:hypothetical protein
MWFGAVAAARAQAAPRGPSFSDALGTGARLPDSNSVRSGRGTFDTLTGNALAR